MSEFAGCVNGQKFTATTLIYSSHTMLYLKLVLPSSGQKMCLSINGHSWSVPAISRKSKWISDVCIACDVCAISKHGQAKNGTLCWNADVQSRSKFFFQFFLHQALLTWWNSPQPHTDISSKVSPSAKLLSAWGETAPIYWWIFQSDTEMEKGLT